MKKIYFLILAFCFFNGLSAQIAIIPNTEFKWMLLGATPANMIAKDLSGKYCFIDINHDQKIQIEEAKNISFLNLVDGVFLRDLDGISNFTNLEYLDCFNNYLDHLDITNLSKLKYIDCSYNENLEVLDVRNLIFLEKLNCAENNIFVLDLSNSVFLNYLNCFNNEIYYLDVSGLINLNYLNCGRTEIKNLELSNVKKLEELNTAACPIYSIDVSPLTELKTFTCSSPIINMKNGFKTNLNFFTYSYYLKYICVDNDHIEDVKLMLEKSQIGRYEINTYCSSNPGGDFFILQGNTKFDSEKNGCDTKDYFTKGINYIIKSNDKIAQINTNQNKSFAIGVKNGVHTIIPILENPTYFNISPTTVNVTFPTQISPFVQDFCVTKNGIRPDLEITLLPIQGARPGFDSKYKIVYKNKGNQTQSGSVNLIFDDAILDVVISNPVGSSQNTNNLSWIFSNLKPFETREITLTLNVNSPMEIPAVNNGDVLKFVATITSQGPDETPIDNTFTLNQTVVGSYDPNDKTCLEGNIIKPELIGQYVHYMIRFENTGTYAAQNVVVKDMIDLAKFDISSLIPTSSSHSFVSKISDNNRVEFIFENINLPFDDANNDGYIAFKIKTLPTLKVGDSFTNEANIYFDYNFPIVTNKATSKFETTLNIQDFEFSNYFSLYPNPANEELNIIAKQNIEIQSLTIYDILGQVVIAVPNAKSVSKIDVSKLSSGNYFVKVKSDKGISSMKFIKN